MIHVPVTRAEIEAEIRGKLGQAAGGRWLAAAEALNRQAKKSGKLGKKTIWSQVKPVLLQLQNKRCAYCESSLPLSQLGRGKGVSDVEHYRPKGRVTSWPTPAIAARRHIDYTVRSGRATGYPELAHDVENFAVACKICNSDVKRDAFPIAGRPAPRGSSIKRMQRTEQPLLLLPVGPHADDPARHLEFDGLLVRARVAGTRVRPSRARVTIDFFELDDREDLVYARAHKVVALYPALQLTHVGSAKARAQAERNVDVHCAPRGPFASAARAYRELYRRDRAAAKTVFEAARDYIESRDGALMP